MCISSRDVTAYCISQIRNARANSRRKRKRGTREKEREKRERSRGDSRDGKREKKRKLASRRKGVERKRSVWILYRRAFYYEVSSCSARSVEDAGEGEGWHTNELPQYLVPWTTPAFPILLIRRRLLQEGYDEGFARESARAHCWSALSRALALNIKTLYMSANVPCSTDDIDLHNKRTLRRKREKRRERARERHKRTQQILPESCPVLLSIKFA